MFVSPKEINEIVSAAALIIGGGINQAFGIYVQSELSSLRLIYEIKLEIVYTHGIPLLDSCLAELIKNSILIQDSLEGTVSEIQLFYTTLTTPDNRKIVIPNGQLADNSLINATAADTRRLDIRVGISYSSDMKLAKEILLNLGNSDEDTIKEAEKAPMAAVEELGDSAVNMLLRVWTPTDQYWAVKFRLTEAVKESFDEAGIEIPFNQLDVHLINS